MHRRNYLKGASSIAIAGLAGCAGLYGSQKPKTPPVPEDRPDAVYYPSHYEGMDMVGTKEQDGYKAALTYSYPHRFWLMKPQGRSKVEIQPADSIHLMPVVWDVKTGIIPPDISPQVTIRKQGDTRTQLTPWPMLSQPMGFHFGDNVQLSGDGTYTVEIALGGPTIPRTGSVATNQGTVSFSFAFEYAESTRNEISYTDVPSEQEGQNGAIELMEMEMVPSSRVPAPEDLPGTVKGDETTGDAKFVVSILEDASKFGGRKGQPYLAVSPRTPYNRTMLPMMALSATVKRGGTTVVDDSLQARLDPDLHYHYGTAVRDIQTGDELTITVDTPPQTARHEGYETAFVDMPSVQMTL